MKLCEEYLTVKLHFRCMTVLHTPLVTLKKWNRWILIIPDVSNFISQLIKHPLMLRVAIYVKVSNIGCVWVEV